jgi:branched-chain amino acid transport system substrate-binding protein
MRKIVILCIIFVMSGIILVASGCSKGPKEIRIGGIFPMTGGSPTFGKSSEEGMDIAVEEFNEKGGIAIGGKNLLIKPIYDDTAGQPEQAANVVRKQIDKNKVVAIVGEVMSKNSLAMAPICQSKGIVMVSSASTNPEITKKGDYIFRVCFLDSFQGVVTARYAYNTLKVTKAAILYDNANDYNKGLASFFSDEFKRLGGQIVSDEAFTDEEKTVDFKAQLTTIKSAKPDFLYLPNYYAASALIMKQAKKIRLNVPAGGGDGWDSPQLVKIGGQSVEGGIFSNHFSKDDPRPEVQSFVKKYTAKYGKEPDAWASLAYDAAFVLLTAIEKSGSLKGADIRDTLKTIKAKGVTGKISFDQDRNPIKSAVILQIKNGKQHYLATINP